MLLAFAPFARTDGVPSSKAAALSAARAAVGRPSVLLFRPHSPGNIGSVARAMLNFGLTDLRVVAPADAGWRGHAEAVTNACGASPLLEDASLYDAPEAATDDLQLVLATTARTRDAAVPVYTAREAAALACDAAARGARVGLLFGTEKNGLSNDELQCAHALVTIPTEPNFSSLNLAQAVLLVASEWHAADAAAAGAADADADAPEAATLQQLRSLLDFSEAQMWRTGFFGSGGGAGADAADEAERVRAAASFDKLRRWLLRSRPSAAEASLLRGALQRLAEPR
jgi:tRNA/rRNA methyltransferase